MTEGFTGTLRMAGWHRRPFSGYTGNMLFGQYTSAFCSGHDIRRSSWSPTRFWRLIQGPDELSRLADEHPQVRAFCAEDFDYPIIVEVDESITCTMAEVFLGDLLAYDWELR